MNVIEFNNVWKKFKKGERFDSLRDFVPAFFRKVTNGFPNGELHEREFWALRDVSFQVKKGEVVGIMGPNGAGKSTILKLLSRIIVPNKGSMKINGRLSALIEVTAGFHPELTGRENVYLNGTILGMKKREIDQKFEQIVEFSGISEFIDTPVKRYSSGMYSRLGFSVAAHMDPNILLVDEVLAVGDLAFRAKCAQKMRELLNSGATIVLVSHQISLIQSLCQRVILLDQGEIVKDGPANEVIPHYQNIVFRKTEEDVRKKMIRLENKVRVSDEPLMSIPSVIFSNGDKYPKENFHVGEEIYIALDYESKKRIEYPIFLLEVIRPDGVVCFTSRTDDQGKKVEFIEGKGALEIHLGKVNLAPGIYMTKFSVWDKDMIHPFVIRNRDVVKIESDKTHQYTQAVYLPEMHWKFNGQ